MLNPELFKNADDMRRVYDNANPYPHIIIDNFVSPKVLDICLGEMLAYDNWSTDPFSHNQEFQINKYYSPSSIQSEVQNSLKNMSIQTPITLSVLNYMYSEPMLNFLSTLTGIKNLKNDPNWLGAGMHKVMNGGKLAIHADFNKNWLTGLYRRINLLVYLNRNWKEEYGGHLELWDTDMSACVGRILPVFNRAVIFTTFKNSYHGHPIPMTLPENVARYSLALYYYTEEAPENDDADYRWVDWKLT
jgi:Rps23 Pro-64 3,4-dihydroxylase Tpa1-like proline 4-hydroxylase